MAKKVLMIDDEQDLVKIAYLALSSQGYEVISANNGQEGIKKAKDELPGAILLDLTMPGMSGLEVLDKLKKDKDTSAIPAIMLTAIDDAESMERAARSGAAGYVTKPFNIDSLLEAVKKHIL